MLSDGAAEKIHRTESDLSLNALSSIVCFLTRGDVVTWYAVRGESQCPLEHCMLSDDT